MDMAHLETAVVDAWETDLDHVKETLRVCGTAIFNSPPQRRGQVSALIEDVDRKELTLVSGFVLLLISLTVNFFTGFGDLIGVEKFGDGWYGE